MTGTSSAPLVTLADHGLHWERVKPDAPCLSSGEITRSWSEVMGRCRRLASGLVAAGQPRGSRVLYIGRNSAAFLELTVATSMTETVISAVNWRLAAPEMRDVARHSSASMAFVQEEFLPLWRATGEHRRVRTVVIRPGHECELEELIARHAPLEAPARVSADDIALQMYTSGTTGLPKGALFSHAALQASDSAADLMGIDGHATVLIVIPIFHAGGAGAAMIAFRAGAHLVVSPETSGDALAETVECHRVTSMTLVPTILGDLVSRPGALRRDLSSLSVISYCGAPISPTLLELCVERLNCDLVQLYGMTEVNGATALGAADHLDRDHPERLRSVGRAQPGVQIRVVDPMTELECPDGVTGEVWIKGPSVMSGYFRAPEETASAFGTDGFVKSGDGGYLQDGYLYLRDRIKDMVVSGGENVYPVEVEKVLQACPGVRDVAVIGVASAVWGEALRAVVVPESPSVTAESLMSYARQNLAGYKCPSDIVFVDELPRNASGKLLKRVLRDPDWTPEHGL